MKKNIIEEKIRNWVLVVLFLMIFMVNINFAYSDLAPVPLGIEGIVYQLDGITQVFEGLNVTVTNLDTSETVVGQTGKGTSGRYSFSLNWSKNDAIRVSVSNPYYSNHTDLVLDGVIRNANLYLDMDLPNVAPSITSQAEVEALEDVFYEYQVTAFDWNEDVLSYSLVYYPENMVINLTSGLIRWTPSRSQKGIHTVKVNVSDGNLSDIQEFEVEVFAENTAPNIVSVPGNNVTQGDDYSYELIVTDDDPELLRYEVYRGAPGMYFENNTLLYENSSNDFGTYIVILDIYDRFDVRSRQIFFFTIEERPSSGGSSRKTEVSSNVVEIIDDVNLNRQKVVGDRLFSFTSDKIPVNEIIIESLKKKIEIDLNSVTYLDKGVRFPSTRVYQYFRITPNESVTEDVKIKFSIDKHWISQYGLDANDVVLRKYIDGEWVPLETKLVENVSSRNNDSNILSYEALSFGFSLFTISHKDSAIPKSPGILVNKINSTYNIIGKFTINGLDYSDLSDRNREFIQESIIIDVVNQRTEQLNSASLVDFDGFFYQVNIVSEKGDNISIFAKIKSNLKDNGVESSDLNGEFDQDGASEYQILYSASFVIENASKIVNIEVEQDKISTHLKRNTPKYELIAILGIVILVSIGLYFFIFRKS